MLAIRSASEACSECHAMSLLCLSTCCRGGHAASAGHDSPWADHGSHGQRMTYVFPSGHSKLLHRSAVDSSRSCHPAIPHLRPTAGSSQSAEDQATPNQHAQVDTCGRISADPSLHSW